MKLEDIPELKGERYPETICVALSTESKRKLQIIKKVKRRDPSELVRMLIDDFLKTVDFDSAS
jgi:hypothetical protein